MKTFNKSTKLDNVCYDIRGPVMDEAVRMESEGQRILKLNIGNPAPFGFTAPDEIIRDMMYNLRECEGYSDSKGLFTARKAIMQYCQIKGIKGVDIGDIYLGNGVSELITMSMQGLLDNGDEILVPSPDYPLWTASVTLAGGNAVHYMCDEQNEWNPDIDDIKKKITPKNPIPSAQPAKIKSACTSGIPVTCFKPPPKPSPQKDPAEIARREALI